MKVHKAGYGPIIIITAILILFNVVVYRYCAPVISYIFVGVSIFLYMIVLNFYRSPHRRFTGNMRDSVVAPADGKIVAIEEVYEPEYFKDNRLQVSIFMSPLNVHANWFPACGMVTMSRHHKGRFQAAYLPKSSTENERSTIVVRREDGTEIMFRQIAGAMARRIVTYAEVGDEAHIDEHFGFIKLGSRVDLFLPLGTPILVQMDEEVRGNQTVIAELPIK